MDQIFKPIYYRLNNHDDKKLFLALRSSTETVTVFDRITEQLKELIKCLNPGRVIAEHDYAQLISEHLANTLTDDYGVWVYYPWSKRLVHILDEDEFILVRTNRNKLKITTEEQDLLQQKCVGIIGLSVGQSIALTMAMERTCGHFKLADFDTAELSNLNRLRTGIHNLGINKAIITAREILEIDPFIKISVYDDGLTDHNIDNFFDQNGKVDLLVEVCDGLDVKIKSRFKARKNKVPVLMDTNDRGMIDIERFDLEPDRPIFHGLLNNYSEEELTKQPISGNDKMSILMALVSFENTSERLKLSMSEIGKTINTWPQLASSVILGGAATTDICRRILLNQHKKSGRYYIDLDEIIN